MTWAGIGSRDTRLPEVKPLQVSIGRRMAELGHKFSSGNAEGSDENFHKGVCLVNPSLATIVLPWKGFRVSDIPQVQRGSTFCYPTEDMFQLAREYLIDNNLLPNFDDLVQSHQRLHARNVYQIFVNGLINPPVDKVIFYAPEDRWGNVSGGTRTAVAIARFIDVETINIKNPSSRRKLLRRLRIGHI
jgi:hypothetical protein